MSFSLKSVGLLMTVFWLSSCKSEEGTDVGNAADFENSEINELIVGEAKEFSLGIVGQSSQSSSQSALSLTGFPFFPNSYHRFRNSNNDCPATDITITSSQTLIERSFNDCQPYGSVPTYYNGTEDIDIQKGGNDNFEEGVFDRSATVTRNLQIRNSLTEKVWTISAENLHDVEGSYPNISDLMSVDIERTRKNVSNETEVNYTVDGELSFSTSGDDEVDEISLSGELNIARNIIERDITVEFENVKWSDSECECPTSGSFTKTATDRETNNVTEVEVIYTSTCGSVLIDGSSATFAECTL